MQRNLLLRHLEGNFIFSFSSRRRAVLFAEPTDHRTAHFTPFSSPPPPHSSTFTLFPHGAKTWEIEGYLYPCVVCAQCEHEIGINSVRVYAKPKQDVDIPVGFSCVLGFFTIKNHSPYNGLKNKSQFIVIG